MLDIKFIRENKEIISESAKKKRVEIDLDKLIALDEKRRELLAKTENLKSRQNQANEGVVKLASDPEQKQKLIEEMQALKKEFQDGESELKEVMKEWQGLMLAVPNIPDVSVPEGKSEEDNVELKKWGEIPKFDFPVKDHVELMTSNEMVDFERGTKVHGFRGYFLKNDGARLSWAVWNYARDFFSGEGVEEIIAPSIVKKEYFYGTGHLPSEAEDLFETQDGDYLSGTAEVPMMAYHSGEILKKSDLPKRFLAFSPCYRREAGSHGKDTKGILRVHEFYKFEQLILCEASHEESEKLHEEITRKSEEFIESLGLPYRRLIVCTGDLSSSKVKQYELELWIPSQEKYREIGSASYYHDFQTRRFNIRYDDNGAKRYAHSLNNTAIPTPRVLISIVENFQQADGKILVPKVLRPYLSGREFIGL